MLRVWLPIYRSSSDLAGICSLLKEINLDIVIEKWKEKSRWRRRRNKLLKAITLPAEGEILDLSCSDGQFLELVHSLKPRLKLFGTDISEEKINDAKKAYGWALFSIENVYSLDFPNRTFDAIFCNMAFHHYDQPEKMLSESKRVLKDGGTIYFMDLFPKNKISQIVYNLRACDEDYHFEKYYTLGEFKKLTIENNLKIDRVALLSLLPRLIVFELKNNHK